MQRERVTQERFLNEFDRRARFIGLLFEDKPGRRLLWRGDDPLAGDENPCFLGRDGFECIAEPLRVIQADGCNDANIGGHGGGGIEPATHAGFENDELAFSLAEPAHRQCQRDLKKRRVLSEAFADFPQRGEHGGAGVFGDLLAGDFDALRVIDEMGRGEQPGALAAGAGHAVDHRASAAFAIGAGDVNHLGPVGRIGEEFLEQAARALQPEFDPKHLGGKQPVDRFAVLHDASASITRNRASAKWGFLPIRSLPQPARGEWVLSLLQFLDPNVGEVDGSTMVLEADGAFRRDAWKLRVLDDHAAVDRDSQAIAFEGDHGAVPFA